MRGWPAPARAPEMDVALHAERVGAQGRKITYRAQLAALPDGTFVRLLDGNTAQPYLVDSNRLLPWSPAGYGPPLPAPKRREAEVLTPRSIVAVLSAGYRPMLHPSAASSTDRPAHASWGDRMTRSTLKRALRRIYALLVVVLGISFLAKIADHVPLLAGSGLEKFLKDAYEYLRDMSLLIATGGVAYITNMFQKRSSFVEGLKEEWRDIIATKSALFAYTQLEQPTLEQYIATFCKLSETIDNMRSVYQNVGETAASSASTPTRRCTICAAPCRRSIRARPPIRMRTRATWCATPSCSRSTPCARPSWRSSIWRSRTTRC